VKLTLFVALALFFGCAESKQSTAAKGSITPIGQSHSTVDAKAPAPFTVVDDAGRKIEFSRPARRVLSLSPANTELVYAVGGGALLVGRTSQCDHPAEATKIPSVGSLFPPDYEQIVGVRPDVVLMTDGSEEVRTRLEERGLKVLVVQPKNVAEVADALRLVGRVLARTGEAESAAKSFETALAAERVKAANGRVRVLYEVWPAPLTAAGPRSFVGDLIKTAGGDNVVTSDAAWPRPPVERIVAADPEVIVVARPGDRTALITGKRPGWGAVTAVTRGHVFVPPDPSVLVRPGPRLIEGLRWLKSKFAESRR